MQLAPGTLLLHYRLVEKVGEGGMGVVWRAVDTTLDRQVAVKILPDVFASDPDRSARFEREARLLASADVRPYGIAPDGARFLMTRIARPEFARRRIDVVLDFPAQLRGLEKKGISQ